MKAAIIQFIQGVLWPQKNSETSMHQVSLCVGVHINKNTCTPLQHITAAQNVQIPPEHMLLQLVRPPAWPPSERC